MVFLETKVCNHWSILLLIRWRVSLTWLVYILRLNALTITSSNMIIRNFSGYFGTLWLFKWFIFTPNVSDDKFKHSGQQNNEMHNLTEIKSMTKWFLSSDPSSSLSNWCSRILIQILKHFCWIFIWLNIYCFLNYKNYNFTKY